VWKELSTMAGEQHDQNLPESEREEPAASTMGRGDSPAVAGSDPQQPEIAEGPVEGLQPGERVERGPHRPPLEVDAPEGDAVPRDAAGEPDAVREQQKREEGRD
jgi:hypothetical protein